MSNSKDEIILELFDDSKQSHKYKLLDIVVFEDKEYAVLLPENSFEKEVEIFKMEHSKDKSATLYKAETNNYIIMQVYEMFKEKYQKYYSERINFQD